MNAFTKIKQRIQRLVWPYGSETAIIRGYLKGYKFVVSENSGWSPICGRWEPKSHRIFASIIKPGQTIFDLGVK